MDFVELGAHCSIPNCHQQDFLPFTCEGCRQVFCREHRSYSEHSCKNVPAGSQVFKCPICTKGINLPEGSNADLIFAEHQLNGECQKPNVNMCPGHNCKRKLTAINSVECRRCHQKVCTQHRYEDQHKCEHPLARRQIRNNCDACGREFPGEEELSLHLRFEHVYV